MDQGTKPGEANSFDLIHFLWRRRRPILLITLIGTLVGLVVAFITPPTFKSEVVMFPAVSNSVSKAVMNPYSSGRDDILGIGDEEDAEHLMQMINTDEIRDQIAQRYDLLTVYDIDQESSQKLSMLKDEYDEHVRAENTKFGSVRVEVYDRDPKRAANMANDIAALVDTVWREMQRDRAKHSLTAVETALAGLEQELKFLEDSLQAINLLGVHDYASQSERYTEQLGRAIVENNARAVKELEARLHGLAVHGSSFRGLEERIRNTEGRISAMLMKHEQAIGDLNRDIPFKFVVNKAYPADRKSKPVRWLVVMLGAISSMLLGMVLMIIGEQVKRLNEHG